MARLLSVNVGLPKDIRWHGQTVHTGIWKHAVSGRCRVRRLNLDGDGQGDRVGHGGEQRAVLVYQIASYHHWAREFGRDDFVYGQFGENLTVDGLPDDEVCVGDRYRIGSAVFEVTQPRVTCYRVGIRMGQPRMAALLVAHHRPGFYMRVIKEGEVGAGDDIVKVLDGPEHVSVADADALVYLPGNDGPRQRELLARALRVAAFAPGWQTAFRNMAADLGGTGWAENKGIILNSGAPAAWTGFRPLPVVQRRQDGAHVLSLVLQDDAEGAAAAAPGQFITLRLPTPAGGAPLLRSYSLTDVAAPGRYAISVKLEPHGAGGGVLQRQAQVGSTLDVAAPRGAFVLRRGTQPVVLLSAGIGATPVLAMLRALAREGAQRPVWWCHGARNSAEHVFGDAVAGLLRALPGSHRVLAYSRPLPQDVAAARHDISGRLDLAALRRLGVPADADFYLCGPDAFMRDLGRDLAAWGVPAGRIRSENFGPGESYRPGVTTAVAPKPHLPEGPQGSGPLVSFVRSGLSVHWDGERYASLLELAEVCDVPVRWACRTGVCHTCLTRLLEGGVAYDPDPLQRPSDGNALICCSRPTGEVTLDR